jgi:hypothetical protein
MTRWSTLRSPATVDAEEGTTAGMRVVVLPSHKGKVVSEFASNERRRWDTGEEGVVRVTSYEHGGWISCRRHHVVVLVFTEPGGGNGAGEFHGGEDGDGGRHC